MENLEFTMKLIDRVGPYFFVIVAIILLLM